MKYCPQCHKQYSDSWMTFCSEDGTILVEEFSPPQDPNWNPKIRGPEVEVPSERPTQWLPRQPSPPPAWVAPDERPPMRPWRPPPPPHYVKPPSQGLAIASMVLGIVGILFGGFCLGPLPGIVALIMGSVALSQIRKAPDRNGGKPFAVAGVITGGLSILFYGAILLWFVFVSVMFG